MANVILAQRIALDNFSAFKTPSDNWQIVGNVLINPLVEGSFETSHGQDILVGTTSSREVSSKLETIMQYGDATVEFDIMLSHGASAVVWIQGRYGLRMVDSWKADKISLSENGAIIPPSKLKGADKIGYIPSMNVVRAPGTWQHVKLVFEAPRFGSNGKKIQRARVVSVEQNGVLIQENQYLSAPSNETLFSTEQQEGPLAFQVNKGHIAIKNIEITKYTDQKVEIEELSYQLYLEKFLDDEFIYWGGAAGDQIPLPDLTRRKPDKRGNLERIHTRMVRGEGNDFALIYEGKLKIPVTGEYEFEMVRNGVGSFQINGQELTRWDILHYKGQTNGKTSLEAGIHTFKLLYLNFGQPNAGLFVKSLGIRAHPLHEGGQIPQDSTIEPILLTPYDEPLIQRSFLKYDDNQKLLNSVNVGTPNGVHYSYDMATGALVLVWRGSFADATPMWHERGDQPGRHQVLEPTGSVLRLTADQQLWFEENESNKIQRHGYTINNSKEPAFNYTIGPVKVKDKILTEKSAPSLKRILQFTNDSEYSSRTINYRLASAVNIKKITAGLYSIDGHTYFISLDDGSEPVIIQEEGKQNLIITLKIGSKKTKELTYSVVW